jgi:aldehyde:ferredoxin oxidoreductase
MINAITGSAYTGAEFIEAGERVWNLERVWNMKAGIAASTDTLPKRLLEEPIAEGPSKGWVTKLNETLPEYYKVRGWSEAGVPSEDKLSALGLK